MWNGLAHGWHKEKDKSYSFCQKIKINTSGTLRDIDERILAKIQMK
jgi:hypothetical protein